MTADEIREARNQYAREWRRQHPDRTREIQEKYWAKRAAVTREMQQKGKASQTLRLRHEAPDRPGR